MISVVHVAYAIEFSDDITQEVDIIGVFTDKIVAKKAAENYKRDMKKKYRRGISSWWGETYVKMSVITGSLEDVEHQEEKV